MSKKPSYAVPDKSSPKLNWAKLILLLLTPESNTATLPTPPPSSALRVQSWAVELRKSEYQTDKVILANGEMYFQTDLVVVHHNII